MKYKLVNINYIAASLLICYNTIAIRYGVIYRLYLGCKKMNRFILITFILLSVSINFISCASDNNKNGTDALPPTNITQSENNIVVADEPEISVEKNTTLLEHYVPLEDQRLLSDSFTIIDDNIAIEFPVLKYYQDIYVYSQIIGKLKSVKIYDPNGNLYDEIKYIAPDTPYIISNAEPGNWRIEFVALTNFEDNTLKEQSEIIENEINSSESQTQIKLIVTTKHKDVSYDEYIQALVEVNPLERYIPSEERVVSSTKRTIIYDNFETIEFKASQYMDIHIYMGIIGAIKSVKIYDPNGNLYDEVESIPHDAPYIISNAESGNWRLELVALSPSGTNTSKQTADIIDNFTDSKDIEKNKFDTQCHVEFIVTTKPTPIAVEWEYNTSTSNPFILMESIGNEYGVVVYENGNSIDITKPLAEGEHQLTIRREIDGQLSDETLTRIRIDTTPPTIYYRNKSFVTQEDGMFLKGVVSEDTIEVKINGEDQFIYWDMASGIGSFSTAIPLEIGFTIVQVEVKDSTGHITYDTVTLERQA